MKKRQLAKLGVTLGLVGAIGVGGTLAILSQTTGPVVNTFAVGDGITTSDISIDETNVEAEDWNGEISETNRDMANSYTITPGSTLVKDPQVHVSATAADCYVFINVRNADAFLAELKEDKSIFQNFGAGGQWVKIGDDDTLDGVYYYTATPNAEFGSKVSVGDNEFDSPKIFTNINLTKNAAVYNADGTGKSNIPKIQVKAAAVQATELNSSWEDALAVINGTNSAFDWGQWE